MELTLQEAIDKTVVTITQNNMPPTVRAEYFGYFVVRVCEHFMNASPSSNIFNSLKFDSGCKKDLDVTAITAGNLMNRDILLPTAGDLAYLITDLSEKLALTGTTEEENSRNHLGFVTVLQGNLLQYLDSLNNIKLNQPTHELIVNRRVNAVRGAIYQAVAKLNSLVHH